MNFRLLTLGWLVGCSGGLSSFDTLRGSDLDADADVDTDEPQDTADSDDDGPNEPPFADAGDDRLLTVGQLVNLDGTSSRDPNGDPLLYTWTMAQHPPDWSGDLLNPTRVDAEFYPDAVGTYVVSLVVDDGELTDEDQVLFTVNEANDIPIANAGSDVYGEVGETVYLDGTASYDPESDALDYHWRLLDNPVASQASLSSTSAPRPSFTPDVSGVFVVELVVQDTPGNVSYPDEMRVIVEPAASSGGGSGGWLGCLSCAAANDRLTAGDLAAAPFLLSFPLLFVLARRRDDG